MDMRQLTRIHAVVRHEQRQRDDWYLVCDPSGRRYVLFETFDIESTCDPINPCRKREISVQTILAQNNELSHKLRSLLDV